MSLSGRSSSLTPNKSKKKYFQPEGASRLTATPFSMPRFFNVQQIQPFKNAIQPKFTNQKREAILKRVELQKEANVVSQARIRSNDLFFLYKKNPFMNLSQQELSAPNGNRYRGMPKIHMSQHEDLYQGEEATETIVQVVNQKPKKLVTDERSKHFRQ